MPSHGERRAVHGRGAVVNPSSRFETLEVLVDEMVEEQEAPDREPTIYFRDASKSIISTNNSPDVPFDLSLNPVSRL